VTNPLPEIGTRLPESAVGPFTADALARYAETSGDSNPLHLDAEVARRAGLAAPPVQGMLLLASFEPALQDWRPDLAIKRLSGRFTQPVLVGEAVTLSGRVVRATTGGAPEVLLRLLATGASRAPALVAEAVLVPREAP
jgi:3-hydroxybutyryl-CoA dehydratase